MKRNSLGLETPTIRECLDRLLIALHPTRLADQKETEILGNVLLVEESEPGQILEPLVGIDPSDEEKIRAAVPEDAGERRSRLGFAIRPQVDQDGKDAGPVESEALPAPSG